jgi:hypothetical protein
MRYSKPAVTRLWHAALAGLLLASPLIGRAVTKGPDAGGYSVTDDTVYSFIDIAGDGGGAGILGGADDDTATLSLPFAFSFYGQPYSMVCVSTNGALYFITAAEQCAGLNDFVGTDLSSVTPVGDRPGVFPFWSDLTFQAPGAGNVLYQTIGAPGSRRFVVQWNDAYPQGSPNPVTFEAILSEGSNTVRFQYRTVDLGAASSASKGGEATIGIRNAGAPANNQQLQWSVGAPVLADLSALVFSAATGVAPTTTFTLNGLRGLNGWYLGPVRVTLNASDPDSAVAGTFYSVDGGPAVTYAAPFRVGGDGEHHVAFYSRDGGGNQEAAKSAAFNVDATHPEVSVQVTPAPGVQPKGGFSSGKLTGVITDRTSGIKPGSATYVVFNPAGRIVAAGSLTLAADGTYSQALRLPVTIAPGRDERRWVVLVGALDNAGNPGIAAYTTFSTLR